MFIDKSMTREVVTVGGEESLLEAREKMDAHGVRHLPVVDSEGVLVGIVTDRDLRSALPSEFLPNPEEQMERVSSLRVQEIMTKNPVSVSPESTLEDALLLVERVKVGALPVVDRQGRLQGIISIRDLMRAFINVLGLHEPGTLLCILAEDRLGTMKRIVDCISEERIPFGSILVARHWEQGKRAVFPYLLTNNVARVKRKLQDLGFKLLDPMDWYLDQLPEPEEK